MGHPRQPSRALAAPSFLGLWPRCRPLPHQDACVSGARVYSEHLETLTWFPLPSQVAPQVPHGDLWGSASQLPPVSPGGKRGVFLFVNTQVLGVWRQCAHLDSAHQESCS